MAGGYVGTRVTTVNTTTYLNFAYGFGAAVASQTLVISTMREAGSFQNLYMHVTVNGVTGGASTITLHNQTSASDLTLTKSIPASTTGEFEDTTHADAVVVGNAYDVVFVPGDATGTITFVALRLLFNTTTNTATRLVSYNGTGLGTASTTYYSTLNGGNGTGTTEAICKARQRLSGTMQNLMVIMSGNTRTTATVVNSRLNGANGGLTVSFGAGVTGTLEDTNGAHADTINVGDDYDIAYTTGSDTAHNVNVQNVCVSFVSTVGFTYCLAAQGNAGLTPNTNAVRYYPIAGLIAVTTNVESLAQIPAGESKQFRELSILLTANSTGTGTLRFRKNASNGVMAASVTASTTGVFSDSTNRDYVVASDEINYTYQAGASAGVTIGWLASWAVKGTGIPLTDSASISEVTPKRLIGRNALPVFAHTYG